MRIHTDSLRPNDLYRALPASDVQITYSQHRSRKRLRAFEVALEGLGSRHTRRRNSAPGGYAATWSDWGRWLAELYARDPAMVCPYYADAADFHAKTYGLFAPCATVTPATLADAVRDALCAVPPNEPRSGKNAIMGIVAGRHSLPNYIVTAAIFGE